MQMLPLLDTKFVQNHVIDFPDQSTYFPQVPELLAVTLHGALPC